MTATILDPLPSVYKDSEINSTQYYILFQLRVTSDYLGVLYIKNSIIYQEDRVSACDEPLKTWVVEHAHEHIAWADVPQDMRQNIVDEIFRINKREDDYVHNHRLW